MGNFLQNIAKNLDKIGNGENKLEVFQIFFCQNNNFFIQKNKTKHTYIILRKGF